MKQILEKMKTKLAKYAWLFQEKESSHQLNNVQQVILHAVVSLIAEFLIEAFSRHGLSAACTFANQYTHAFLYNALLIFTTTLPVFLVRRRKLLLIFIVGIWLCGGIANGVILSGRVTPFTGPDLKNITEAAGIIDKYLDGFEMVLLAIASVFAVLWLISYFFRCPRYKGKIHYPATIGMLMIAGFCFAEITTASINAGWLSSYFGNIAFAYEDYGFPYCFSVTALRTGINMPNNYSEENIAAILAESDVLEATVENTEDLPNVIVIQLESFFDCTRVNYLETSEDPIPNWHRLSEEYSSGFYTVPTIGAGTANTEFETLTGMSLRFFGAGEYPFKGILKDHTCESSAYVFKSLGYGTFGLHNNEANFYSRKKVYKNLGFDLFVSEEYMQNQDDVNHNGWMRDENLIQPILDCLDSTDTQDYVFTVSVQPHGSYPTEQVLEEPVIQVSGSMTDEQMYQWEYYVNQIHEEDQFVQDLIDAVNARGEKTVIFFYGDHLPTLGLENDDLTEGTNYQTEWLMWNNCGLSQNDSNIISNEALAMIFDQLGIHEGTIFRYHQSHNSSELDYMSKLQSLQYDLLYGEEYVYGEEGKQFAPNVDYHLGVNTVTLTGFEQGPEDIWYIYGTNFTQSCKVMVNKTMQDTTYVNDHTLLIVGTELKVTDKLRVGIQSNSKTHKMLAYTKPIWVTYSALHKDEVNEDGDVKEEDPTQPPVQNS